MRRRRTGRNQRAAFRALDVLAIVDCHGSDDATAVPALSRYGHAFLETHTSGGRLAMEWTYANLLQAREAVAGILAALELEAYFFAVEPRGDSCEVRVEYPVTDGWKSSTVRVDDALLLASRTDAEARQRLVASWRASLTGARRAAGRGE
jgi:hypothetical protein